MIFVILYALVAILFFRPTVRWSTLDYRRKGFSVNDSDKVFFAVYGLAVVALWPILVPTHYLQTHSWKGSKIVKRFFIRLGTWNGR